jgi:hypothetical protein
VRSEKLIAEAGDSSGTLSMEKQQLVVTKKTSCYSYSDLQGM